MGILCNEYILFLFSYDVYSDDYYQSFLLVYRCNWLTLKLEFIKKIILPNKNKIACYTIHSKNQILFVYLNGSNGSIAIWGEIKSKQKSFFFKKKISSRAKQK